MKRAIIARADNTGLGNLSWEFARHINFDKTLIIKRAHQIHPDRFSDEARVVERITEEEVKWLSDVDVLLTIETPYDWKIYKVLQAKNVLIPMYECTAYPFPYAPDLVVAPSLLDKKFYEDCEYLPIPINRDVLPFRKREKANIFVHNAGQGGASGRNGTKEILEAMSLVKSEIKLIINSQTKFECADSRVEVRVHDYDDYWQLWQEGDVFLFPEKWNGLSLPIQEAMSVGMPIMCTNRYPFNAYLPRELMIEPIGFEAATPFSITLPVQVARISPEKIAQKIDEWAGKDISRFSEISNQLAELISWKNLQPKWEKILTA